MKTRPKIKVELSLADKIIEIIGLFTIMVIWILIALNYASLPETIPTHYNGKGEIDGFGAKSTILILPLVTTAIYILISLLNRVPHYFNYPVKITAENAFTQYTNAMRLLRYMKLAINIIFGILIAKTILVANGKVDSLGAWFLPLMMIVLFVPILFFLVKSFKSR